MKKFDLYNELENIGFTASTDQFGRHCLNIELEKEVEVAWLGRQTSRFAIEAAFNQDHSTVTVYYFDGGREAFKVKSHMNEKRAMNAIRETARNKGFEI